MKRAAYLALGLVLALSLALIYQLVNSTLTVRALAPQVVPAAEQPAEFARLQEAVSNRALIGTPIEASLPGTADDYSLVVFTLRVSNKGFLPAEMVELQVSPATGDMLFYTDGSAQGRPPSEVVAPGQTRDLRCVLLTRASAAQRPVRDLFVSYYIWGNPFRVKVTASRLSRRRLSSANIPIFGLDKPAARPYTHSCCQQPAVVAESAYAHV